MASSNMTGIFQGAIVIKSALESILKEFRTNTKLIRDALGSLPQDDLTNEKYGDKTIDECVRWFRSVTIPVKLGLLLGQRTLPVIVIEMNSTSEADTTLGDTNYTTVESDPWNVGQSRELGSVHASESFKIHIMTQGEPEYLLFLDTLVRFGILRHKLDLLEARGFTRLSWTAGDYGATIEDKENLYIRSIVLNGFVRHTWPIPTPVDRPTGNIEETYFGPRMATAVHNEEGTATSSPVTPTEPVVGGDPFSAEYWESRDILSGDKR